MEIYAIFNKTMDGLFKLAEYQGDEERQSEYNKKRR